MIRQAIPLSRVSPYVPDDLSYALDRGELKRWRLPDFSSFDLKI